MKSLLTNYRGFGQLRLLASLCFIGFFSMLNQEVKGQCIQATSHSISTIPFLSSVTSPGSAYDLADGNTATAATLTVNGIGIATLNVNFDEVANSGDSIIVLFGVPTLNILDWGSLGGTTFTPYSGVNGAGTASASVAAANLSFIITVGANSVARIAIPVTASSGAQSLQISFLGIGAAINKRTFIYDVAVKPGPVVTSVDQALCAPGGTATFTGQYNVLSSTPIDVIWYDSDGTTALQTDLNRIGAPYVSSFTTPTVTATKTFYVRERWDGCTLLSDPRPVTVTVRPPITPDISINCGSPITLSTTTTNAQGSLSYLWVASNGGNIVSGASSSTPTIDRAGSYQVTITDANGCLGVITEPFTTSDCASLPVALVRFKVVREESTTLLEWKTSSEINSDRFNVERSGNGKSWEEIGSVHCIKSHTEAIGNYSFRDLSPNEGENFYRLKMIDLDGTYSFSHVERLKLDLDLVSIYPNPVSEVLYLDKYYVNNAKRVSLLNTSGIRVYTTNSVSTTGINVRNLPSGTYFVRVGETGNSIHTFRIVISR